MKRVVFAAIMGFALLPSAYGCGCTDGRLASDMALRINKKYIEQDLELAQAMKKLGDVLAESYTLENQAALDIERIARIKKAQLEVLEQISFDQEKNADLLAKGNQISAKIGELNLIRLEQAGILKSTILEKRGQ